MDPLVLAGTDEGLACYRVGPDDVALVGTALDGEAVREVTVDPADPTTAFAACGLRGTGLYRVDLSSVADSGGASEHDETSVPGATVESSDPIDLPTTLLGLNDEWVWGVAVLPSGRLLVGTEPPAVSYSDDAGSTLTRSGDVATLAEDADWFFWNEPHEAGHVHGFASHPDRPDRVLAGVEIGGALRSDDAGESWTTIPAFDGNDCHAFAVDPDDSERWWAISGDGLRTSTDGGATWRPVEPLADSYVAAGTFDADGRLLVSAAPDSKADVGSIWRRDASVGSECTAGTVVDAVAGDLVGESDDWTSLATHTANSLAGVPAAHPTDPEVLCHVRSTPEECHLLVSRDAGESWDAVGPTVARIRDMAVAPPGN